MYPKRGCAININKHARSAVRRAHTACSMWAYTLALFRYPIFGKAGNALGSRKTHLAHRRSQLFPSGRFCMQMESPSRFLALDVTRACRFYCKRAPDRKKKREIKNKLFSRLHAA
jgi:hypothetical protein